MEHTDSNQSHEELVVKLTTGFGAMLEQVQELARRNTDLEDRLAKVHEQFRLVLQQQNLPNEDERPEILQAYREGAASEPARHRPGSSSKPSADAALWSRDTTGEENAVAIADGVYAWKALTKGEGPLWQRFRREENEKASRRQSREEKRSKSNRVTLPKGHPIIEADELEKSHCPFGAMAQFDATHDNSMSSARPRPQSLPTPPPAQDYFPNPSFPGESQNSNISPQASVAGSASKCPIRMLDERSPEEIARYFETHKHEIPRSHAICVKRHQSNAESIRQLDAKYGSLVHMIQGLGMKHQPLLPAKDDDEEFAEMDAKSARKVEKWAGNVENGQETQTSASHEDLPTSSIVDTEERQGHFDRPLKEIRVGESPSRPWGISVPGAALRKDAESEAAPTPRQTQSKAKHASSERPEANPAEKAQMVFTGPVFIGYSADQAADLIQKCGWDPQGPNRSNR